MGLETATYISDLVATNPVGAVDPRSQGDDHLRLIKAVLKNTFPNISGAVSLTHTDLNNAASKTLANIFTADQTIDKAAAKLLLKGTGNAGIEIGRTDNVASTPYVDFHSGTDGTNDYDARMQCTGGTASDGQGTVNIIAAALQVNGSPVQVGASPAFPAGTKMLFQQTAAPTGWTKELTHNNKALRLTTGTVGSGGTQGFTTAFASKTPAGTINSLVVTGTVQNHALTIAQLPVHNHGASGLTFSGNAMANHNHGMNVFTTTAGDDGLWIRTPINGESNGAVERFTDSVSAGTPSGSITGNTANAGSGSGHNHGLVMDSHGHTFTGTAIDLAVQYVDFIIAVKD